MGNSWTYPIAGKHVRFPSHEDDHVVELPTELHYFTKQQGSYTPSGVLRSVALFIDGLSEWESVEAMTFFPEQGGWGAMITVYHDSPPAEIVRGAAA
jgi:hypothetical protein